MDLIEVAAHEWEDWKANRVTKAYIQRLYIQREGLKEELAEGKAGTDVALFIGRCQGIKDSIDYAVTDFEFSQETEENAV